MSDVSTILDILAKAVQEGRSVKITADEVKISPDESTANALEITIE